MDTYRNEVIDPGDMASKLAHEVCVQSFRNSPLVHVVPLSPGNFRGPVGFSWKPDLQAMMSNGFGDNWELVQIVENDGAGGKPQFFTLLDNERTWEYLGWEIITMTLDDLARRGAIGAVIDNEVNIKRITKSNYRFFSAMMRGYGRALAECNLVNLTGETAVMKHQITAFCDDPDNENQLVATWGASCIGLLHRKTYVDPANIKPEMAIVGFKENGYRCNGGTFFTSLIMQRCLNKMQCLNKKQNEWNSPELNWFLRKLTIPSQSYARLINRLVGWTPEGQVTNPIARIAGIAHITGGGVWGKFREILPEGVGANLYCMPDPPEVLKFAQEWAFGTPFEISDLDCYSTFHGGCGMMVVCPMSEWEKIVIEARNFDIDAQLVGVTIPSDRREVQIVSRFKEGCNLSSDELGQKQ